MVKTIIFFIKLVSSFFEKNLEKKAVRKTIGTKGKIIIVDLHGIINVKNLLLNIIANDDNANTPNDKINK